MFDKTVLITKFPDFYSYFPAQIKQEEREKCYSFLNEVYQFHPVMRRKWNNDVENLKNRIFEYCYKK